MDDFKKRHSADQPGEAPTGADVARPAGARGGQGDKDRLIRQAQEVVYRTPEVRPEKVARLKEAIEQGNYEVDARRLADILIDEIFPKR